MKLGIKDVGGTTLDEIAEKVGKLGFEIVGLPYGQLEKLGFNLNDRNACHRIKSTFSQQGIKITELGACTNIIHPNTKIRKKNIEYLQQALKIAPQIDCSLVITGSGSLNPKGDWFAHPENYSAKTWKVLVESLKEITKIAEENNVFLGLEPHTVTPLGSVERLAKVVKDVGSRKLGINLDPVNLVTYDTYFHTEKFLNYMFDVLEDCIVGIHVKDVSLEDRLIIHLNETYSGNGNLDFETFLRRSDQLDKNRDLTFLIEHTEESLIPEAKGYVEKIARKVGICFDENYSSKISRTFLRGDES